MCTQTEVRGIVGQLAKRLSSLFDGEEMEPILFGSYARADADDGSDIDVLFLVDASRQTIARRNWQVGEAAAEMLLDHGVVVSPIVENRDYFQSNAHVLPLFQNIQREGVRLSV